MSGIGDKGKKRKHYKGWSVSRGVDPPIVNNKAEVAKRYKTDGDSTAIKNIFLEWYYSYEKQGEINGDQYQYIDSTWNHTQVKVFFFSKEMRLLPSTIWIFPFQFNTVIPFWIFNWLRFKKRV